MMKTRIYTLLAAMLLTVASVQAQDKTATTISVSTNSSITAGEDARVEVTLSAEINAIATLTVTDGASYNKTFNVALLGGDGLGGSGSFIVPNLPVGTYSITASFAGNEQYAASTSEVQTVEVSKVTTAFALRLDDNKMVETKTIYVGDFIFFVAKLLNPNKLDSNNQPSSISINTVATIRLTDKETFDDNTDKVRIEGLVGGTAYDSNFGYKEDGNRVLRDYSTAITDLPAGTYKLKATFAGNDVYTGCESNVVTLTVSKIATTLTVADITAITTGQDAVITLTATPTEQNVAAVNTIATVTVGGTDYKVAIVNGTGTCYVPNLTAGSYEVTASIGDDKYADSSSGTAKTLMVNAGNPIVESNSVATVTMTPAINTVVQVTVGNTTYYVPVENGSATFTLPQQVAGTHDVQAAFSDDGPNAAYAASTSTTQQLVTVTGVTFPFASGQEWATWCDDWAWAKPEGVTAYTISGYGNNTVTITAVEGDNIPSHTPLLLRKTGDAVTPTKVITGTVPDTGYDTTTGLATTTTTDGTFWGNATDAKITDGYEYTVGQGYSLYGNRFVRLEGNPGINAHRCILTLATTNGAPVLSISEEATGIGAVLVNSEERIVNSGTWYSLDGRKLDGIPTKKGLYIHNGRKVVMK